jgi:hypothetical protein
MNTMNLKILFTSFIFITTNSIISGQQKLEFNASQYEYNWANASNKLAVLVTSPENKQYFLFLDINGKTKKQIDISKEYRIRCFCWDWDDQNLLATIEKEAYSMYDLYQYSLSKNEFTLLPENLERLYSGISGMAHDKGTKLWCVEYYGEGHPDIAIYEDRKLTLNTDVFPGGISILGWLDGALYVSANISLEYGINRKVREKSVKDIYKDVTEFRTYKIDVKYGKAYKEKTPEALQSNKSFDKKNSVKTKMKKKNNYYEVVLEIK